MVSSLILGGRGRCCFVGCWIVVLFTVLLLPHQTYSHKVPQSCFSSCGKIRNITHPFRLNNDPDKCGDKRYELKCRNNVTVLNLFSGEFYVQSINYNNYTIRVVDPNIQPTKCSSLPRYFLYKYNFTDRYFYFDDPAWNNPYVYPYQSAYDTFSEDLFRPIIYLNCTDPDGGDAYYVETSSCVDKDIYAIAGDLKIGLLKPGCHVKMVTVTSFWGEYFRYTDSPMDNVSYLDIHRALLYGFELSWFQVLCSCSSGYSCYHDQNTGKPVCESMTGDDRLRLIFRIEDYFSGIYQGLRLLIGMGRINSYEDPAHLIDIGIFTGKYVLPFVVVRSMLGVIVLFVCLIYTWRRRHASIYENIEEFLQDNTLMPIRYSYKEIKQMTKSFKEKLGEGGYGYVYKGKLRSGPFVAIKMLNKLKANGQEFISEVATIGRIHHSNVVQLIGFCVEGSKRALVYEYMPNGSLDKYIFSNEGNVSLTYKKIYEIALGVAHGISYLHQGCDMQILHFDIKPHNILLDENFTPKVSDFGLAKLYPIDNSIVTMTAARGTIGYMAPELFYQNIGGVSYKADVYSFGMLLMEMASKRKKLNPHVENISQIYFPLWIYDQLDKIKEIKILENVSEEESDNVVKKMIMVALWCIQLKPSDRPSMKKIIQMLEGEVENIEMPPKPSLYPHETIQQDNTEINSSQIQSNISSTSYVEECTTIPLLYST